MDKNDAHVYIIAGIFAILHWTQLGTEFVARTMPVGQPGSILAVTKAITTLSMWLLALWLLPKAAKLILWVYGLMAEATDRLCAIARRKAISVLDRLRTKLNGQ